MFTWFKVLFGRIFNLVKPAVNKLATEIGEMVLDYAIAVVSDLEAEDLLNEEKREIAANRIRGQLKDKGLEARESLINYGIETAVQLLKDKAK